MNNYFNEIIRGPHTRDQILRRFNYKSCLSTPKAGSFNFQLSADRCASEFVTWKVPEVRTWPLFKRFHSRRSWRGIEPV